MKKNTKNLENQEDLFDAAELLRTAPPCLPFGLPSMVDASQYEDFSFLSYNLNLMKIW